MQLGEHFKPGAKGFLAGTSSVLCSIALPAKPTTPVSSPALRSSSFISRGKAPPPKTTGAACGGALALQSAA